MTIPAEPAATVALLRCPDYESVGQAIERLGDLLDLEDLFRGRSVLLKVNVMKGLPPERALCTHPEFVRAAIRLAGRTAKSVSVGDSSGVLGQTAAVLRSSGIARVAEEEGAEVINFDACRPVAVDLSGDGPDRLFVPEAVLRADLVVSLPKLKTHDINGLTGAVKNQVGLLPGGSKCFLHVGAATPEALARRIVRLNLRLPPALSIMDGVWGLEGGGSSKGRRKEFHIVAAGRDPVALDAVCASVMGLDPASIPTNRIGGELGLGCSDLEDIEIVGDGIEQCLSPCRPAPRTVKSLPVLGSFAYRIRGRSLRPKVEKAVCEQCRHCESLCPVDAIQYTPYPDIGPSCIFCYACYENCPVRAYRLAVRWYLGPLYSRRAGGLPGPADSGKKGA